MKKLFLALSMLCLVFTTSAVGEFGDTFTVNGINYVVSSGDKKEVKVGSNPTASGVITIPAVVSYMDEKFNVVEIGGMAFDRCKKLKEIHLPVDLKTISTAAFNGTGLRKIDLPSGITEIDMGVFSNSSIESVVMPSSLRVIDEHAFMNCKKLKQVALNEGLKFIGRWAFLYTGLKKIYLPASIETIKVSAFPDCMREVQCDAITPPSIMKMTFSEETYEKGVLFVPAQSVDVYRAHEFWGQFQNIKAK